MSRLLAVFSVLAACDLRAAAVAEVAGPPGLPAPDDPFVHAGACPDACCTYGVWTATAPVDLVDAVSGSKVVARVDVGGKVVVDDGELHVRPVETTVTRDKPLRRPNSRDGTAPHVDLHPGDRVIVLTGLGGGFHLIWANGHYYTDKTAFLEPGACPAAGDFGCWAEAVPAPGETWWVQVHTADGTKGWARATSFTGWESCG